MQMVGVQLKFTKTVCKQAGIVASLMFGQVMQEQILGSQSSYRYSTQFLNTTVLSKITDEKTML